MKPSPQPGHEPSKSSEAGELLGRRGWLLWTLALAASLGLFALQIGFGSWRESRTLQHMALPGVAESEPLQPYINQDSARWAFELLGDSGSRYFAGSTKTDRYAWTWLDNAPEGRPLFWSSIFFIYLECVSGIGYLLTGSNAGSAAALPWGNIPLLVGFLVLAGWATARWRGLRPAVVLLLCAPAFYELVTDFGYAMTDHHSMLNVAAIGSLLFLGRGLSCGGPEHSRRGLLFFAGLFTAVGLALLATQMLLLIGAIGLGGALWLVLVSRSAERQWLNRVDPRVWRWWAWSGAVIALAFYLLEVGSDVFRFSKQLEVNHPFWALGLAAGGEVLYRLHHLLRPVRQGEPAPTRAAHIYLLIVAGVTALIPVAAILIGGADWHVMRDPLIYHVHRFIPGFQPAELAFWKSPMAAYGVLARVGLLFILPLTALAIALRKRLWARPEFLPLLVPAILLCLLTLYQERWAGYAAVSGLALVPLIFTGSISNRRRLLVSRALVAGFVLIAAINAALAAGVNYKRAMLTDAVAQMAIRDVGEILHQGEPVYPQVVMMSRHVPGGAFFPMIAKAPVVGSLYWENASGLRDEMTFFTTKDMEVALQIAQDRQVDYVLTCARREVVQKQLQYAMKPFDAASAKDTLIFRLCAPMPYPPDWLEPVPLNSKFAELSDLRLYRVKLPEAEPSTSFHQGESARFWVHNYSHLDFFLPVLFP